ncbi:class I SAM-dependent methyltransferase [Demequina sp. SYSU T00192]|uniref:Class I SAM-dependent methyltransferase n=1 Tax=Demequina litoralis TaxID=3051660 RepID=A0ABT8G8L5_9MICO|nr:class I SAM-dependent methyltransferase [Demequina sp. SYSU T00192]MDN4475024.1 class I SAM-dependent methyltransferase [Demequina sp. SYSU T00192]
MDPATARLTASPACLELAASLRDTSPRDALAVAGRLRKAGHEPALVAAAMSLAELRREARPRLGDAADAMVFHRAGLEQASRAVASALHAERFAEAGCRAVADLTAGLGADARAVAARGLGVVAFEADEATAVLAAHNLSPWPDARVIHGDSLALLEGADVDGVFADPARRNARGRRHDPADYSPPLDQVLDLATRYRALGVKAGPGLPHEAVPEGFEAQWVSVDGDVVEVGLWAGAAARRAGHSALVVRGEERHEIAGPTDRAPAGPLGAYLLEPDGAVIRAGLVGVLAAQLGAHLVDPSIAYLTADAPIATPFARAYRVLERLPLDVKVLARELHARDIGTIDIKKRGVDLTPEQLRPRLKLRGSGRATLVLTRLEGRHAALLVEPV